MPPRSAPANGLYVYDAGMSLCLMVNYEGGLSRMRRGVKIRNDCQLDFCGTTQKEN